MNSTKYQVWVDQTLSEEFKVITGLKQDDVLSPLLINIIVVIIVKRSVKNNNSGTNICAAQIDILGFGEDLILVGNSMELIV